MHGVESQNVIHLANNHIGTDFVDVKVVKKESDIVALFS